jgi:hypothetical protein
MSEAVGIQSRAKVSREAVPKNNPIPGVAIAMQTFGDFLGYNPYSHIPNRGEQMVQYHGCGITIRHFSTTDNPHSNSNIIIIDSYVL